MHKQLLIKKLLRYTRNLLIFFFASTLLAVIIYRFMPVYVTPLMVIRSVQQVFSGDKPTWKHTWVSFDKISPNLPMAVIASEDNRFAEHNGFDRDTAQDLLHDGFLKIFDSFDKFTWRGEGSLRAWMERVMVNTALQYLRKNDVINQSAPLEELPEEYEEPDASDVEAIPQKVLMQFIEELPAGYRTVFNLYTFEDKSHKEIAQELGINEKSSASQLFRAKSVLAKRVKEWIMHNG